MAMNIETVNSIGEVIRKGRKTKGLTQKQLAEKVYVPRQKISYWENGRSDICFKDLENVCRALDIEIEFMMPGKPWPDD